MPMFGWRKYGDKTFTHADPRIEIGESSGCWLWTGARDKDGYGVVCNADYNTTRAHRAFYLKAHGINSLDGVLDHQCKTRNCVNPLHLRVTTHRANVLHNSNGLAQANAAKPNCPLCGGEFVVVTSPTRSWRQCPPCQRQRVRECQRKLRLRRKHERVSVDARTN